MVAPREREILQLLPEGKSNKDVANLSNLSVYTVKTHRSNIMEKLNLRGIPEFIPFAVRKPGSSPLLLVNRDGRTFFIAG